MKNLFRITSIALFIFSCTSANDDADDTGYGCNCVTFEPTGTPFCVREAELLSNGEWDNFSEVQQSRMITQQREFCEN